MPPFRLCGPPGQPIPGGPTNPRAVARGAVSCRARRFPRSLCTRHRLGPTHVLVTGTTVPGPARSYTTSPPTRPSDVPVTSLHVERVPDPRAPRTIHAPGKDPRGGCHPCPARLSLCVEHDNRFHRQRGRASNPGHAPGYGPRDEGLNANPARPRFTPQGARVRGTALAVNPSIHSQGGHAARSAAGDTIASGVPRADLATARLIHRVERSVPHGRHLPHP